MNNDFTSSLLPNSTVAGVLNCHTTYQFVDFLESLEIALLLLEFSLCCLSLVKNLFSLLVQK
ncbi:hypothetical protein MKW98_010750 [Papaver atlanticum]|uniref:Uncharacterized protein n=1 Tax=Papaver atlanticum TaxID=357466 RepID=A0AAD4SPN7_9MAGN|nr:hypothetical protein MKW98_010750 [Papaver atlanticum]